MSISMIDENGKAALAAPREKDEPAVPANPEVMEKVERRRFPLEYKRRILREADRCERGDLGALLRREGLYSSHLVLWREQRQELLGKRSGKKDEATVSREDQLTRRIHGLEREKASLLRRLQQAEIIIEVQKKLSEILKVRLPEKQKEEI